MRTFMCRTVARALAAALIATCTLAGAARAQETEVDASVALKALQQDLADAALEAVENNPENRERYRRSLLRQELAEEAARRGLTERFDVRRRFEETRRSILINALKRDVMTQAEAPGTEAIRERYEKEKERWVLPEAFRFDAYNLAAVEEETRQAALNALADGTLTTETLREMNVLAQVTRESGQWVAEAKMAPALWTALRESEAGVYRKVETENGVWILRRADYRERTPLGLEQVEEVIREQLRQEAAEAMWEKYLQRRMELLQAES